jgi:hypothetical protein
MINHEGDTVDKLIEIKPKSQKRMKVNRAKWKQAEQYCAQNNMEFVVLTEDELF